MRRASRARTQGGRLATPVTFGATALAVIVLVAGFLLAAVADVRRREVTDRLWQAMGAVGVVTGAVVVAPGGLLPVLLWLLVGALTLEHLVGWDLWLGPRWGAHADRIEIAAYVATLVVVAVAGARFGIGPRGVPWEAVALLSIVVLARGLFELKVLYGAADAKALMIAALLVPVFPMPLLYAPGAVETTLSYVPFAISLLTNAALFSIVVPLALAVRNLRRGEFSVPEGFMGYSLPVRDLPHRFVWVKDPAVPDTHEDDTETTDDDDRLRARIARDLEAKGVPRVWVTPQVPLVAIMAFGAVAAILAGNVLLDVMLRL
ncbi:MAG: hypothetical protein ACLQD8_05945 [Thermoplasmata archaeon]